MPDYPNPVSTTAPGDPRIRAAIAQAAGRTGVDFSYLYNQARIESSLDPQAKARTSSAAGLFQFTRGTWLEVVKAHGSAHGAGWATSAIAKGRSGLSVADPQLRTAIDQLRYNPEFASAMAAEFAADNRGKLEAGLGRTVEPVDLYLAHFLGSGGAMDFLTAHDADPDAAAASLFPAAAAANRTIFYTSDGALRSLDDIRTSFAAKLDGLPLPATSGAATSGPPLAPWWTRSARSVAATSERAPMQMASIEPLPERLSLDFAARAYQRLSGLGA
jgi:Transglycosylase SLT domain